MDGAGEVRDELGAGDEEEEVYYTGVAVSQRLGLAYGEGGERTYHAALSSIQTRARVQPKVVSTRMVRQLKSRSS